MIKKRIKQASALVLSGVLVFSAWILPKVSAAIGVETEEKCSVVISVPEEGFKELNTLDITVDMYKVAGITVTGEYTAAESLKDVSIPLDGTTSKSFAECLEELTSETSAAHWEAMAAALKAEIDTTDQADKMVAAAQGVIKEGTVTIDKTIDGEDLTVGLYLVYAQQALSDFYQYDFTPYLISLPNNYFYENGNDDWVYENVAIGLKPEKSDRYGDLIINKTLDVFNETIGGATFVFQVEAYKKDVDTVYAEGEKGKCVYSDVVSMTFEAPGTERITIKGIPAGAEVSITEVYSGASYELTSDAEETATILAEGEEGAPVSAAFFNTYNQKLNGGNGVVNSFVYNGNDKSWDWIASDESPSEIQNTRPVWEQRESDAAEVTPTP